MSKVWNTSLCVIGLAAALMLMIAGCNNDPPAGTGGAQAPAPAGTNIPAPGLTPGGPGGAGGNGPGSNGPGGH